MFKSRTMRARRIEMLCAAAVSVAISRPAIGQEQQPQHQQPQQQQPQQQQPQQQPPLPPVTIQAPKAQGAATKPSAGQGGKHRLTRRQRRERERANAAAAAAVAAAAQQAAAAAAYRTREGSEAQGYKPSTVNNLGPFGQVPILNAPYSVNVISSEMWENIQAATPDDVFRISPVVQQQWYSNDNLRSLNPNLRGFANTSSSIDGLRQGTSIDLLNLEDKDRVEVLTGLTGFLYGGTDVGGMINYVFKKPTPIPYYSVTLGDYGNLAGVVHLDAGGPIDKDNTFAYRLNIVGQDGTLWDAPQNLQRALITGVFDWNIAPGTTFEVLGSHHDEKLQGEGAEWVPQTLPSGASLFNYKIVPNPLQYWNQPYAVVHDTNDRFQTSLNSKIDSVFTVRAAYAYDVTTIAPSLTSLNYMDDNFGNYDQYVYGLTNFQMNTQSAYGFVDANFATGTVEHKLTIGSFGNYNVYNDGAGSGFTTNTDTFYNVSQGPVYTPAPNITPTVPWYGTPVRESEDQQINYVIGDAIKFTDHWSALVGVNYATIQEANYNGTPPFGLSKQEAQARPTPTVSLIYKPVSWLSTYATYSESLLPGVVVPSSAIYTNAGQILPIYLGTEYEIGAKADVHGVLLTGAWFNINKANQYAQPNPGTNTLTYVSDGREVHQGFEVTATGTIVPGVRILGGLTLMDATVVQTASITTDNKRPVDVADQFAKVTLEYDLPYLRGVTLTGGVYYTGNQAADAVNAVFLAPFVTEDVGVRYRTTLPTGQEAIFRLNIINLTNHAYWLTNWEVGQGRTVAFSGQVKF